MTVITIDVDITVNNDNGANVQNTTILKDKLLKFFAENTAYIRGVNLIIHEDKEELT